MSGAFSFDPWEEAPEAAAAISTFSRISRGEAAEPQIEVAGPPSPSTEPPSFMVISSFSRISSDDPAALKSASSPKHDAGEAAALAAHHAAPADPHAYQPTDPDPLREGLRLAAMRRLPAWADNMAEPSRRAVCICCDGRRWWEDRLGWRCSTCHPRPRDYRASGRWREVRT